MKNRKMTTLIAVIAIALFSLVAIIVVVLGLLTIARKVQVLEDFAPPEVIVTNPSAGSTHPAGLVVEVSASALGFQPITRVELWLDGELKESRTSEQTAGITPFYVDYALLIPEGPHNIVVRAVNSKGVVGQSIPLNIFGAPADENALPSFVFPAEEGETLADLGKKTGLDPKDILAANPALAGGVPPGGTNVIVPVPEGGNKKDVKPNAPPQNQPAPKPKPGGTELKVNGIPFFGFLVENPPVAPSELSLEFDVCWVKLQWKDNATNESGYRVWRSSPGTMPTKVVELKSSPGTGLVKYQFAVPFAGIFNIWVEAVNQGGAQPSNIKLVNTMSCSSTNYDEIQLEVIGMRSIPTPDKSYCYVSQNNKPDFRIPKDENSFIKPVAGVLNISDWASGSNKYVLTKPGSSIDIEVECWGWFGGSLSQIGYIEPTEINKNNWTGSNITLMNSEANPTFWIDLSIKPLTSGWESLSSDTNTSQLNSIISPSVAAAFNSDPTIPVPGNVRLERYGSADGNASDIAQYEFFWERTLKWDLNGDKQKVTGYAIYLNGNPYKIVEGSSAGETQVKLPTTCGQKMSWQVTARSSQAQSALSSSVDELLPPCNTYIEVKFVSVDVDCLSDGWGVCGNIAGEKLKHTGELYYYLSVGKLNSGKITQYFYWGDSNFHPAISWGYYKFSDLGNLYVKGGKYKSADTLVIPIYTQDAHFDIEIEMWDHNSDSDHDLLFHHMESYDWSKEKIEQMRLNCGVGQSAHKSNDSADIRLYYEIHVLPNSCNSQP